MASQMQVNSGYFDLSNRDKQLDIGPFDIVNPMQHHIGNGISLVIPSIFQSLSALLGQLL